MGIKRTFRSSILPGLFVFSILHSQNLDTLVHDALSYSDQHVTATLKYFGDSVRFPRSTDSAGVWKVVKPGDWTSGFFPGCLWYMEELTHDNSYLIPAQRWTDALTDQQFNTHTHDIGFIMFCSFGNEYRLKPNEECKKILLQAARSLSTRFNPTVGCIRSWDNKKWEYPVIIDNMMNLELLFWAAKNGGSHRLYDIAVSHAVKTMENHVRKDGSTYHVVSYDTATGKVLERVTHQGYADESVWSRGQAWAIYGFTTAYKETNDDRFLKTAQRTADYFIDHLPGYSIPYWDFREPDIPNTEKDASAAAIACSGLFSLASVTDDSALKTKYNSAAKNILRSLCQPPYLSVGTSSMGLINHTTGNHPDGTEINVSLIYGDYYFLESIQRYLTIGKQ